MALKINYVNFEGKERGKDFHVLTHEFITINNNKTYPFERKVKKSIFEIVEEHGIENLSKFLSSEYEDENSMIIPTGLPIKKDFYAFKLLKEHINLDYAVDCGLGVILMDSEYYVYNSRNEIGFYELMFEIYLSLVVKEYYNTSIARMLDNDIGAEKLIKRNQNTNDFSLYMQLLVTMESKKGGDNVVHLNFGDSNGKNNIFILFIYFFIAILFGFSVILVYMIFDYELILDYKNFKSMASFSLESEYMKPYVKEKMNAILWNIAYCVGILLTFSIISINLLFKVYNLKKESSPYGNKSDSINIENRIYYEGKIRGLSEVLRLIELHKDNVNMYGDKLIQLLNEVDYPNIVVDNDRIIEYVKEEFNGDVNRLSDFMADICPHNKYHLISKNDGNLTLLNAESVCIMLNDILYDYDIQNNS